MNQPTYRVYSLVPEPTQNMPVPAGEPFDTPSQWVALQLVNEGFASWTAPGDEPAGQPVETPRGQNLDDEARERNALAAPGELSPQESVQVGNEGASAAGQALVDREHEAAAAAASAEATHQGEPESNAATVSELGLERVYAERAQEFPNAPVSQAEHRDVAEGLEEHDASAAEREQAVKEHDVLSDEHEAGAPVQRGIAEDQEREGVGAPDGHTLAGDDPALRFGTA